MKVRFILLYIFLSFFSYCFSKSVEIDKIVAVVNNQAILDSDINQVLFYLKQDKNSTIVPLKTSFLRNQIIEKLIIDTLILEEANKFNITVSDEQVDMILKNIAFKKNITLDEFKREIILNNTNEYFDYKDYIQNIKKLLKIKIFQDYILNNNVHVSEKELYHVLNKKIKKQNELKKLSLKLIILPFSKKENYQIVKHKKILVNNIFKLINNNSNFDYFYEYFKKNKHIFLTKKILLESLKNLKKTFFNKLDFVKKNQVLGPILGNKGLYIIKVTNIEDNSIKKIITEFHIEHCSIYPSIMLNNSQAKKDIFEIYNNIKTKRYSFEYAVENFSHDVYSSHKKGDLGWVSNKSFNCVFKNILIHLKKNEISKPVKSKFGWHIIKLLEKRKIDSKWSIEKEKIYQILLKNKMKKAKINWIKTLKKSSFINIFE